MRHYLIFLLFILAVFGCCVGYTMALIDWIGDYKSGIYDTHYMEAASETGVILLYTALGIRFLMSRIHIK
ncbi:hypothetical protein GCM10027592_26170 [Spirosoma flavus]